LGIHTSVIGELPAHARQSARQSVCHDIVVLAIAQAPKYIKVEADSVKDLTRFYKTMIHYRVRHSAKFPIEMRKCGNALYIWGSDAQERFA